MGTNGARDAAVSAEGLGRVEFDLSCHTGCLALPPVCRWPARWRDQRRTALRAPPASQACFSSILLQLLHTRLLLPAMRPFHPCSNVAEFNRGDLFVIRYRAIQGLLAEGAVELV